MKRVLACCSLLAVMPLTCAASDRDFNAAVSSIEHTYHVHREHVPMVGFVSFCAHVYTGGAVKGLMIADFEDASSLPADADMPAVLATALGSSWSLIVDTRSNGEQDLIYAHPAGDRMRLLVASHDHGNVSLVRVELNGKQFARWINKPGRRLPSDETH